MGKKAKKRAKTVQKSKQGPSLSPKPESQTTLTNTVEASEGQGGAVTKDTELCSHIEEGFNFDALTTKLETSQSSRACEDCRGDRVERQGKKNKGKQKASLKAIWVCLQCGHCSCGGAGLPTTQQSHSVYHAKKNRHPLAVHYRNHQLVWCHRCNKLISAEISQDEKLKEGVCEVVRRLKEQPDKKSGTDVEDVWFGSGSVTSGIKPEISASNGGSSHLIRGLINLGNTCFFNSIMQNLLAMKRLGDLLLTSGGESSGPLSASMRKLFLETTSESNSRGAINPRSVFGSLCTKAPQFRGYQQHDSHELLSCLLDALSSEQQPGSQLTGGGSRDSKTGPTLVDSIFGGQLSSTVCCLECGHSSTIVEPFLDLSLPVPIKNSAKKRAQRTVRDKKPKLPPPKRSVRNRPKTGKVSTRLTNGTDVSEESTLSNAVDANGVALEVHPTNEDGSDSKVTQNPQAVSSDCCTWLDYLEPDPVCNNVYATLETDKLEPNNGIEGDDALKSATCPSALDSCTESTLASALAATSLDVPERVHEGPEPVVSAAKHNHIQEFEEKSNTCPEFKEETPEIHYPHGIAEQNAVDSYESQRVDGEHQLRTRDPEIIPLPTENVEIRASSSVAEEQKGDMELDGFGNLFDEPDENVDPKPLENCVVEGSCVAEGGHNGSNSDSEPNEVDDNKDAPVSVESCFLSFTKPELLSKDEHGWQCDNCSKILHEQRIKSKQKHQMHGTETLNSRCKDPTPNGAVDAVITCQCKNSIENNIEKDDFDCGSVPVNENIHENGSCMLSETANQCEPSTEAATLPHEGESTDEEVKEENLKVKRDATKAIHVSKAPPILTVHLKRFSQEARGRLSKLNGHVTFKEAMDLKPYMDSRAFDGEMFEYRLMGVVEHLGNMRGGHYVAYVRGVDTNWYHASDAYVREASLDEVLRCQAYILFYERT